MEEVTNEASTGVMASDINRLRCEADSAIIRLSTRVLQECLCFGMIL
jgi:hypothetical protein